MPREATGSVRLNKDGTPESVIRVGKAARRCFVLGGMTREQAEDKSRVLAGWASRMRRAGLGPDEIRDVLEMAVSGRKSWETIGKTVDVLAGGKTERVNTSGVPAFKDFSADWTDGELAKRHPDHVREKRSSDRDEQLLRLYVNDVMGRYRLDHIRLEHCDAVMASLPEGMSPGTRRQVAQVIHRVLRLAVMPARILKASPIPSGWLPAPSRARPDAYLYPENDEKLLRCAKVPLWRRLAYGILDREGMRRGELAGATWADFDLEHGIVRLDRNKTDDPRAWALDPGVVRALEAFRKLHPDAEDDDPVLVDEDGNAPNVDHLADQLRTDLETAGVNRPELTKVTKNRKRIRAHDLRATFVTVSLANGKSEQWVMDRTGHRSSGMIQRYRRAARTWEETRLGSLLSLDSLLFGTGFDTGHGGDEGKADEKVNDSDGCTRGDLNPHAFGAPEPKSHAEPSDTVTTRKDSPRPDETGGDPDGQCQSEGQSAKRSDPVEEALADALRGATAAGQWDTVAQLARELQARREARAGVVDLAAARRRGVR